MSEGESGGAYAGADDRAALDCAGEDVGCEDEVVVGLVFCVGRVWPEARHDEGWIVLVLVMFRERVLRDSVSVYSGAFKQGYVLRKVPELSIIGCKG